jgi:hypothetical protein
MGPARSATAFPASGLLAGYFFDPDTANCACDWRDSYLPKKSNIESLVTTSTGRFLSGWENLYQRISPCFILHPKPALQTDIR